VHRGDPFSYAKYAILTSPKQENSCNKLEEKNIKYNNNNNNNNNNWRMIKGNHMEGSVVA
jgi:hypothetical protein